MKFNLEIGEYARLDIKEAIEWYNFKRKGLGDEFLLSLEASVSQLQRDPLLYAAQYGQIRRLLLKRFPYQ